MIPDKKLHRRERLVARAVKVFIPRHVVQEPYLRRWIAGAENRAFPAAEFSSVEIGALLVAVLDRAFAVVAARCAGREGKDGDRDLEGGGERAGR